MRIKESRAVLGCGITSAGLISMESVSFSMVSLPMMSLMLQEREVELDNFNIQTDKDKSLVWF